MPDSFIVKPGSPSQQLLDWVWKNCQDKIRQSIRLKRSDKTSKSQLEIAHERLRLLDKITQVQRQYLVQEEVRELTRLSFVPWNHLAYHQTIRYLIHFSFAGTLIVPIEITIVKQFEHKEKTECCIRWIIRLSIRMYR